MSEEVKPAAAKFIRETLTREGFLTEKDHDAEVLRRINEMIEKENKR